MRPNHTPHPDAREAAYLWVQNRSRAPGGRER